MTFDNIVSCLRTESYDLFIKNYTKTVGLSLTVALMYVFYGGADFLNFERTPGQPAFGVY